MQQKDYYRILEVEEDATDAEIKTAYRKLARKYHPDVSILQDAEERFKEVVEAYDTLRDSAKRATFDRFGYWARELRPAPDWERQFSEVFCSEVLCGDEDAAQCDLGDLFALFRVDNDDLTLDLPVTPWEAALGATVEVPTLQGRVRLRLPPGTQSNRKLRLAGRGLPKPDGTSGDLYAVLRIVTPTELSEREKELFAELARASSFEPREHLA